MTVKIFIVENPFNPTDYELLEADDVCASIMDRFPKWPATARIFNLEGFDVERARATLDYGLLAGHEVTPHDEAGIDRLGDLEGPLMIAVAPAGPIALLVLVVAAIVLVAVVLFLLPKIPPLGNQQQTSPNNALSGRTNSARPNGRIPDIFGTVRAIPDLIAVPYSMFANNIEYEIALMCVGRGDHAITDICDDKTPVDQISGTSVQVYGPFKSPNNASPDIQIGVVITSPMYNIIRSNSANGQTLLAPDAKSYQGVSNIRFGADYTVQVDPGAGVKFTDYFANSDLLTISGSSYTYSAVTFDGDGTYPIISVADHSMLIDVTGAMVAEWAKIAGFPSSVTGYLSADLYVAGAENVGPIVETIETDGKMILNFVALNGLYKDDGTNQFPFDIDVQVSVTEVDALGNVLSGPVDYTGTVLGSATTKGTMALTMTVDPGFAGIASVIVKRLTPKDRAFKGTVVDEVKLRDFYSAGPVTQSDFGNVTTVFAKTIATNGALVIKERKLNMQATRKIRTRNLDGTFTSGTSATDSVDDIFSAICTDPYIGARSFDDLDLDSIYGAIADVAEYFGNPLAKSFGYTFDNDNLSFEETGAIVAQAAFCIAYRQGRQFKLSFERATEDSVLLFNARNTIPQSQKRTVRFGVLEDHDGVELDYVDPADGAPLKFYVPADMSAISPMTVDVPGIRSTYLANLQSARAWNKMRFQNIALELEATQEAVLTIRNDRVLASDLTRPQEVVGGEIVAIDGVRVTLSDDVNLDPAQQWSIYIQHVDSSVEILGCFPTAYTNEVDLSAVPRLTLSLDELNFTRAKYEIIRDDNVAVRAYLVAERIQASPFTQTMHLINYSFLYYQNDQLELWLDFGANSFGDSSPYERNGTAIGSAGLATDPDRGIIFLGGGAGSSVTLPAFTPPESYTKAVWISRANMTVDGSILGNAYENFGFGASTDFQAGHGGVDVSIGIAAANIWHHLVVTYDLSTARMVLYLDGIQVDHAGAVPVRTLSQLSAFVNMPGRADDLRLWHRALTGEEIKAIYRSTVVAATFGGALETEDHLVLETEDGHGISWS